MCLRQGNDGRRPSSARPTKSSGHRESREGPNDSTSINPTASQVMSPTDLPQCHQRPGDSEKLLDLLDHHESTQILGLGRWFVYEHQEDFNAATQREQQRVELEEIAGSLKEELTLQAEQHRNHFAQQEQICFASHLRSVESHLQAEVANTRCLPPAREYC